MFRALYHGFFVFFEKDEKTQQMALSRAFNDLDAASKLNPGSVLPHLFKAEIFERTYLFQMISIYDPRHDELNKTMLGLLNNALSIDGNNVWALKSRALVYFHLKNWRPAIADYDKILSLNHPTAAPCRPKTQ